ncbi:MAG: hypothetical protein FJ004_00780 [Chloroflexi bacterium]|nr:hypothetical protein [Chloroflexota bacterium]
MKVPVISEMIKYSSLAWDLRAFLKHTITLEDSKRVIAERLQNRERNFLNLVEKGIYANPESPYFKLLGLAGCELGDFKKSVNGDGIEATLSKLLAEGVYISWEEFKGKKELVRGGTTFHINERDFDNPYIPGYYYVRSSGSRSAGTRTMFDLGHLMDTTYYRPIWLKINDINNLPVVAWLPPFPSKAGISTLLRYYIIGHPVLKWFSPVNESQTQASLRDRLASRYVIYGGKLWGAKLVKPEYVSPDQAVKIAQWLAYAKKQFGGSILHCFVSSAVKVSQAAIENRLDISGSYFFVTGEPLTEAKLEQIRASGTSVTSGYFISEIDNIGLSCPGGRAIDDVHLFYDSVALIQHSRKVKNSDLEVNAFLLTCLLPSSPKILLNMESDDYGVVENVRCGCLFEELGLKVHVHSIRSFSKLTGSGVTIVGTDFVRILESVLPGKFGGAAIDYQLLEEEDSGQTRLSLVIDPRVGNIDEKQVIDTVLEELRRSAYGGKLAAGFWSQMNTIQVKRMAPLSSFGKIIPMHLVKKG